MTSERATLDVNLADVCDAIAAATSSGKADYRWARRVLVGPLPEGSS